MQKSPAKRLNQGVGIVLTALVLISICSFWSINNQSEARRNVMNSQSIISVMNRVLVDLQNAETGQRGYELTKDDSFLEPYEYSIRMIPITLTELRSLLKSSSIQMRRVDSIERLTFVRMGILSNLVSYTRQGKELSIQQLEESKRYMDECRIIIDDFNNYESEVLDTRLEDLDSYSFLSSIIIVSAGLLSFLVAIGFYLQVRKDIISRALLEQELKHKDKIITKRIQATQEIASKIANGDFSARVNDEESDELGSLTTSMNEMASSLEIAFKNIKDNEWRQSGIALLNESFHGNQLPEVVAHSALTSIIEYCKCINGAFYIFDSGFLKMQSCYGFESYMSNSYEIGEGIIGQAYVDHKMRLIETTTHVANCTNGGINLSNVIIIPLLSDDECLGVIELGSVRGFTTLDKIFLEEASLIIALELESALSRMKVQALLEETQAQSEELQSQHSELENMNFMLEEHTQQLQVSEEELKVQQEELLQTNQELEERSKQLEEKNDIVAQRNLEIQKKAEELEINTKYKSEFLANMSHELRTPLNSILLLSRLMMENIDENLNDDQIESAKVIESSGNSLLLLIDEILDLSKIEAGKMRLEFHDVHIDDVVLGLESMFKPIVIEKGLLFIVEIDDDVPKVIEIDQLRLEQVLRNFLSNAIKFTAKGHIKLKIFLDTLSTGYLNFQVEDTGIGIEKKNQQLIFEAFQQADGSTRRKFGGTGLGLAISREIARLFEGEIKVFSTINVGSSFTLIIPTQKINIPTVKLPQSINTVKTTNISTMISIPDEIEDDRDNIVKGDKVILIVEDDTAFAKALLQFSQKNGYKVVVIVRGDLVIEAAEKYFPLAILLDIQLPVKDGWQVMDELKNNEKTRHIPVHTMSSLEAKEESLLKGAIDFINKPVALEQVGLIFNRIDQILNEGPRKVLIVEENAKHALALAYFLSNNDIRCEIKSNVNDSIAALLSEEIECVILDMGELYNVGFEPLEEIKKTNGLENLPIIIFTGKSLSGFNDLKMRQLVDSVVVKTAHSFQRILDEVGLFLHLVEENRGSNNRVKKLGRLHEVLENKTVLIADDDVRNIFFMTKILEQYNMVVLSAMDGKEAIQQLENNPSISIVLMDMMMPEMNGYESIREIRKNPNFTRLPIIAVTAKAMMGDSQKCIDVGASDYISKPVDKDQLLSLLRVWLYE